MSSCYADVKNYFFFIADEFLFLTTNEGCSFFEDYYSVIFISFFLQACGETLIACATKATCKLLTLARPLNSLLRKAGSLKSSLS